MEDAKEIREEAAALLIDYFPPYGRTEMVRQALELAIACGDKRSIKELLQLGLKQQQQTNQRTKVQLSSGHREENELFILILAVALSFAAIAVGIAMYFYQKGVECEVRSESGSRANFVHSERGSSKRFYTEKAIPRKFIRRNLH